MILRLADAEYGKKGNVIDKKKHINLKCIYVTLLQEDKNGTICH